MNLIPTVGVKPIWTRTISKLSHAPKLFTNPSFFSSFLLQTTKLYPLLFSAPSLLVLFTYYRTKKTPLGRTPPPPARTTLPPAMSMRNATDHQQPQAYASPPVTIVLTIILLVFFFVAFFSIYFCRCFMQNLLYSLHLRNSPSGTPVGPAGATAAPGLDPSIIMSFPTFTYSSVKEYRREKYGLECAICLCEFLDDDTLRLLTSCNHVFHQECIDLWLESQKSCPVCRRSLDTPENIPVPMEEIHEDGSSEGSVSITIKHDHEDERGRNEKREKAAASGTAGKIDEEEEEDKAEKFTRSKTTGHSIVRSREEEDKFTLILPEHVRAKLIRGHKLTRSCTSFGEFKSKRTTGNGGFGEVSGLSGGDVNNV